MKPSAQLHSLGNGRINALLQAIHELGLGQELCIYGVEEQAVADSEIDGLRWS